MLGHYDAGFTLRTYTHATRQMQDDAAEIMAAVLNPAKAVLSLCGERKKEPVDVEFSAAPQAGNGTEQVSSDEGHGVGQEISIQLFAKKNA